MIRCATIAWLIRQCCWPGTRNGLGLGPSGEGCMLHFGCTGTGSDHVCLCLGLAASAWLPAVLAMQT